MCRWLGELVDRGTVHPLPPHSPGYRAAENRVRLQKIYDLLKQGYFSDKGTWCMVRNLKHLAQLHPEVRALRFDMNLTTWPSVWRQLQQQFPEIQRTTMAIKKVRESPQAQCTAQQLNSTIPMKFEFAMHDYHPLTRFVLVDHFEFTFKLALLAYNIFGDAGDMNPQGWMIQSQAIWIKGMPKPRTQVPLMNKSVCCLLVE
jgi:hypothetical protein